MTIFVGSSTSVTRTDSGASVATTTTSSQGSSIAFSGAKDPHPELKKNLSVKYGDPKRLLVKGFDEQDSIRNLREGVTFSTPRNNAIPDTKYHSRLKNEGDIVKLLYEFKEGRKDLESMAHSIAIFMDKNKQNPQWINTIVSFFSQLEPSKQLLLIKTVKMTSAKCAKYSTVFVQTLTHENVFALFKHINNGKIPEPTGTIKYEKIKDYQDKKLERERQMIDICRDLNDVQRISYLGNHLEHNDKIFLGLKRVNIIEGLKVLSWDNRILLVPLVVNYVILKRDELAEVEFQQSIYQLLNETPLRERVSMFKLYENRLDELQKSFKCLAVETQLFILGSLTDLQYEQFKKDYIQIAMQLENNAKKFTKLIEDPVGYKRFCLLSKSFPELNRITSDDIQARKRAIKKLSDNESQFNLDKRIIRYNLLFQEVYLHLTRHKNENTFNKVEKFCISFLEHKFSKATQVEEYIQAILRLQPNDKIKSALENAKKREVAKNLIDWLLNCESEMKDFDDALDEIVHCHRYYTESKYIVLEVTRQCQKDKNNFPKLSKLATLLLPHLDHDEKEKVKGIMGYSEDASLEIILAREELKKSLRRFSHAIRSFKQTHEVRQINMAEMDKDELESIAQTLASHSLSLYQRFPLAALIQHKDDSQVNAVIQALVQANKMTRYVLNEISSIQNITERNQVIENYVTLCRKSFILRNYHAAFSIYKALKNDDVKAVDEKLDQWMTKEVYEQLVSDYKPGEYIPNIQFLVEDLQEIHAITPDFVLGKPNPKKLEKLKRLDMMVARTRTTSLVYDREDDYSLWGAIEEISI